MPQSEKFERSRALVLHKQSQDNTYDYTAGDLGRGAGGMALGAAGGAALGGLGTAGLLYSILASARGGGRGASTAWKHIMNTLSHGMHRLSRDPSPYNKYFTASAKDVLPKGTSPRIRVKYNDNALAKQIDEDHFADLYPGAVGLMSTLPFGLGGGTIGGYRGMNSSRHKQASSSMYKEQFNKAASLVYTKQSFYSPREDWAADFKKGIKADFGNSGVWKDTGLGAVAGGVGGASLGVSLASLAALITRLRKGKFSPRTWSNIGETGAGMGAYGTVGGAFAGHMAGVGDFVEKNSAQFQKIAALVHTKQAYQQASYQPGMYRSAQGMSGPGSARSVGGLTGIYDPVTGRDSRGVMRQRHGYRGDPFKRDLQFERERAMENLDQTAAITGGAGTPYTPWQLQAAKQRDTMYRQTPGMDNYNAVAPKFNPKADSRPGSHIQGGFEYGQGSFGSPQPQTAQAPPQMAQAQPAGHLQPQVQIPPQQPQMAQAQPGGNITMDQMTPEQTDRLMDEQMPEIQGGRPRPQPQMAQAQPAGHLQPQVQIPPQQPPSISSREEWASATPQQRQSDGDDIWAAREAAGQAPRGGSADYREAQAGRAQGKYLGYGSDGQWGVQQRPQPQQQQMAQQPTPQVRPPGPSIKPPQVGQKASVLPSPKKLM